MLPTTCSFKPETYANLPIGMFHCPECGEMVIAGMSHPGIMEDSDWEEFQKAMDKKFDEQESSDGGLGGCEEF